MAETYEGSPCAVCGNTTRWRSNRVCANRGKHESQIFQVREWRRINWNYYKLTVRKRREQFPELTKLIRRRYYEKTGN